MTKSKRTPGYYDGDGNEPSDANLHAHGIFPGKSQTARTGPAKTQKEAIQTLRGIIRAITREVEYAGAIRLMLSEGLAYFGDFSIAPQRGWIFRDGEWTSPPDGWTAQDGAMEHSRRTGHVWWFEDDSQTYCQECGEFWTDEQFKPTPK